MVLKKPTKGLDKKMGEIYTGLAVTISRLTIRRGKSTVLGCREKENKKKKPGNT